MGHCSTTYEQNMKAFCSDVDNGADSAYTPTISELGVAPSPNFIVEVVKIQALPRSSENPPRRFRALGTHAVFVYCGRAICDLSRTGHLVHDILV